MQGTGDASTVTETPAQTPATKATSFTQEQIAASPVLSGSLSPEQAKVQALRTQQLIEKMPAGEWTNKQASKLQSQFSELPFKASQAESNFFAAGGQYVSDTGETGYGWSNKKIIDYYKAAGMEDKGYEIVSQRTGYDRYGNPVPVDKSMTATFKQTDTGMGKLVSETKGLSAAQSARLDRLKDIKKSGTTLTPKQKEKIKKLKGLAKG